eukprot:TRINITY_DN50446_c0_g1_i1.p1 TRINITY_DN50446_c0_g1~~TRINITY_DN50446_c0_g1_i1.p1  ORF type:complete len:121 (-),score=20.38 TRINITY_DN50446_c0_g1_i1:10-348(-)
MKKCPKSIAQKILDQKILEKKPFPEKQILLWMLDVSKGLIVLHEAEAVHRDIKPGNLLLDENNCVVIADFGFARVLDFPPFTEQFGTTFYNAQIGRAVQQECRDRSRMPSSA